MPAYEAGRFSPPAPVVAARLLSPRGGAGIEVSLLIDTGADVSVLPIQAATAVGAAVQPSSALVQFYSGDEAAYFQADLRIEFLRYRIRCMFLLADAEYGILGRNILNLLRITLDGPQLSWSA